MSNERAFDYMRTRLLQNGMELESLAREALTRRRTNPSAPLLLHDHYRNLGVLAMNEIMLETNLTTRPPSFLTNPVLYVSALLLGWTISKTNDVIVSMREPNGQRTWRALKLGMLAYTAILPLVQALGGSGYLQYVDLLNNALSLDNAEARVTARINVGNILRARDLPDECRCTLASTRE